MYQELDLEFSEKMVRDFPLSNVFRGIVWAGSHVVSFFGLGLFWNSVFFNGVMDSGIDLTPSRSWSDPEINPQRPYLLATAVVFPAGNFRSGLGLLLHIWPIIIPETLVISHPILTKGFFKGASQPPKQVLPCRLPTLVYIQYLTEKFVQSREFLLGQVGNGPLLN